MSVFKTECVHYAGIINHHTDTEDETDGGESPRADLDVAFQSISGDFVSVVEAGATASSLTTDEEAVAAYLRVLGDRLQAEYGNRLDGLMNELNWTLARDALLADIRRVLSNLVSLISDVWTRVRAVVVSHIL